MRDVNTGKSVKVATALMVLLLSACSTNHQITPPQAKAQGPVCVSAKGSVVPCQALMNQTRRPVAQQYDEVTNYDPMADSHPLVSSNNTVLVADYVEQMATDMLESLNIPLEQAVVGVTSFVEFSDNLSAINPLGNMLAETFIFELQQNGIPVVDYKVTDMVTVAANGDYIFSRNPQRLNLSDTMSHVLTGTIMYNKQGLILNARMVNFETKRVVASSKALLPYFVLDSVIPASEKHAVIGS